MNLFSLFKKKKVEKFGELNFQEINNFIKDKEKEFSLEEEKLIKLINNKMNFLISELKEGIINLEKINLEEKKEQFKLKKLTLEGIDILKKRLVELIDNLNKIEDKRLYDFIKKLNICFDDFYNKSKVGFEKSKILIGKEIALIEDSIKKFSNEYNKSLCENQNSLDLIKKIREIKDKLIEMDKIILNINKLEREITNLKEEIDKNQKKINKNKKRLLELKSSKEYKNQIFQEEKLNGYKIELNKNLILLKNLIDFKKLTEDNHSINKNMEIIKKYKDKFNFTFDEDNGEFFKRNINNLDLNKNIDKVLLLKEKINNFKIEKVNFDFFEKEITNLEFEIEILNKNIERLNKNKEDFNNNLNSLKLSLVKLFGEIKIKLII